MFWIAKEASVRVLEDAECFFEPNAMLASIAFILSLVPIEPQHI
jgi:hypothetical protein